MVIHKGFTLLELMIVIAVLGILAAVAYPSYQNYVKRTKRVDAQAQLVGIAQKMTSYKLANGSFYGADLVKIYGQNQIKNSSQVTYNLHLSDTSSDPTHSWMLTATPVGMQVKTGALSIDHQGQQCWYKETDDASGVCSAWSDK